MNSEQMWYCILSALSFFCSIVYIFAKTERESEHPPMVFLALFFSAIWPVTFFVAPAVFIGKAIRKYLKFKKEREFREMDAFNVNNIWIGSTKSTNPYHGSIPINTNGLSNAMCSPSSGPQSPTPQPWNSGP